MNEKDLNIEYICKKTLLNKDDELVPIILDLMQECYRAGLCQAEYDNTMNLIEENQELKQKYENAVADYESAMFEKEQLKKQLDDANEKILLLQASEPMLNYKKSLEETQQKEFIKWLEVYLEKNGYDYSRQSFSKTKLNVVGATLRVVLQKYKSIIGVSDENNKQ